MDSSNGQIVYHYKGVKYIKDLDAPDNEKIKRYAKEFNSKRSAATASMYETYDYNRAVSKERSERVEKAKADVRRANAAKLAQGDAPNGVIPGGGVASGDPGISQRRTVADQALSGVKTADDNPDGNATAKTVITDSDRMKSLPTLADKLNDIVYEYPRKGFVTRAIKPSGQGTYFDQVVDMAYQMSGHGHQHSQLAQVFKTIDRYEKSLALKPTELTGYTFITRPRLNLSDSNIAADRRFTAMRTDRVDDVAFGIRCMLDTQFCKDHWQLVNSSPLIDMYNPFAVLLCNSLTSISGFQDPVLSTETTEPGYFQESQSYSIGGDRLARGYDFTLTFRDYPGSPVAATFDYWYQYLMNLGEGTFMQYADAIDANRLDYTVSIYRFIVDRTRRVITKWAKCTGCFPTNAPTGVPFNKNQGEGVITSNDNFGINFKVNHMGYTSDPIIIQEFNMLVRRYVLGSARTAADTSMKFQVFANEPQNNFTGIPYVRIGELGYELVFLHDDPRIELVPHSSSVTPELNPRTDS